jgi:hypothetical protein
MEVINMEVKSLNILGKTYKVKNMPAKVREEYMGICQDDIGTIYMSKKLREGEEYWTTLFHELGHGVIYRNGTRFSGMVPPELEEILVETMSQAYYTTFKKILRSMQDGEGYIFPDEVDSFCKDTK